MKTHLNAMWGRYEDSRHYMEVHWLTLPYKTQNWNCCFYWTRIPERLLQSSTQSTSQLSRWLDREAGLPMTQTDMFLWCQMTSSSCWLWIISGHYYSVSPGIRTIQPHTVLQVAVKTLDMSDKWKNDLPTHTQACSHTCMRPSTWAHKYLQAFVLCSQTVLTTIYL